MPSEDFKLSHVAVRVLADLTSIHVCMIVALAISVFHPSLVTARIQLPPEEAVHYYISFFVFLSLVFPAVFLLTGLYTRSPEYQANRAGTLFRSVAISILAFPRMLKGALQQRLEMRPAPIARRPAPGGTVLIVGGAGYIGSCLVRKLLAAGRKVRVMDSLMYGDYSLHDVIGHPNLQLQVGDCRKLQDLVAAARNTDAIIHLAAIVGDPACELDPQASREIN